MAVSTKRLKAVADQGFTAYFYGHSRDAGKYENLSEREAYRTGWDRAQRQKPGVELQRRYQNL